MKILITMAGAGSRFQKIGITKPKYEIVANGKTLFEWSLAGLSSFFKTSEFVFISRLNTSSFIEKKAAELGIQNFKIMEIDHLTSGQAETVYQALLKYPDESAILVFNIDTYLKISSAELNEASFGNLDGWLQLFNAPGEHWSFAKLNEKGEVVEVTEKKRISPHASTGLYYFKSSTYFKSIFEKYSDEVKAQFKETYIAPFYQYLLKENKKVGQHTIEFEKVIPLGTPDEVKVFDSSFLQGPQ